MPVEARKKNNKQREKSVKPGNALHYPIKIRPKSVKETVEIDET